MNGLDPISREYVTALERQRGAKVVLTQARARFAERLHGVDTPAPSPWRFVRPALALATVAVVAVVAWPEAPLGVSLRGQPDATAEYVRTAEAEAVLDFSDGSEVVVRGDSEVRLLGVTPIGAQVALERGAAHVDVVHRQQTKWAFVAGPYRVHVVGTRFELAWRPEAGGLEVTMDEGIVEVEGPGLRRQRVTSGQRLEAFAEPARASLYLEAEPVADEAPAAGARVVTTVRRPKATAAAGAPKAPRATGPSWRYLADQGNASGAMAAAEEAGFDWLVNSMPRGDVLDLGDVARQAKQPARAKEAWLAVRERFAGTGASTEATRRLGRLAAEVDHDDGAAARWFERAVREAPNGPAAPDATREWLEALVRAGRRDEARAVAADSLRRFKNGSQATLAKELLGR
jgi:ferric-dicitrate binding protein FerR (iron transport regulator)